MGASVQVYTYNQSNASDRLTPSHRRPSTRSKLQATPPPPLHWLAAALVALSTYMHSAYGPAPPSSKAGGAKDKGGGSASRSSNKMASKKRQ